MNILKITGPPASGKSTAAIGMAALLANGFDKKVTFLSLDMTRESILWRLAVCGAPLSINFSIVDVPDTSVVGVDALLQNIFKNPPDYLIIDGVSGIAFDSALSPDERIKRLTARLNSLGDSHNAKTKVVLTINELKERL
jgi:hypothetical protein